MKNFTKKIPCTNLYFNLIDDTEDNEEDDWDTF